MAAKLDGRDREARQLNDLREMLHAAHSFEDVGRIVPALAPGCLPGSAGRLFLLNASRNLLSPVAGWGDGVANEPFPPDACWSFRLGRAHVAGGDGRVPCQHGAASHGTTACIPLMAQGDTVGLLQLVLVDQGDVPRVAAELGEILALTLANMRLREAMRNQATRDPLTGLFNRRYLEDTAARELARVRRTGSPLSVVMLDVDHFKKFNDTHGHAAGDAVLKEVAGLLRSTFRTADVVCRYGGEEFLVLMPDCASGDAVRRAEALRAAVASLNVPCDGRTLGTVTISAGVATFPADGTDEETLFHAADEALYASKHQGRDRITAAPPRHPGP
ncbi:MAG: diguanylate cyclase [Anaeromyxobacter sp.]